MPLCHADYRQQGGPIRIAVYSDRIEIENPGLLLPGLTVDDLFDGVSRLRNRMIARFLLSGSGGPVGDAEGRVRIGATCKSRSFTSANAWIMNLRMHGYCNCVCTSFGG
jgi:hypothetical protein